MWLEQMKMIMNEYRLNLGTQEAQEFLIKQMEDYFFGEGAHAAARLRPSAIEKLETPAAPPNFETATSRAPAERAVPPHPRILLARI